MRRISVAEKGAVGEPKLHFPKEMDIFEHNTYAGNVVDFLHMQDHAYSAAVRWPLAFTADGSNGLTVYDLSKDPTDPASGFVVSNIGGDTNSKPDLGRASDVALWDDAKTGRSYAFAAAGSRGIGVVDVTDVNSISLIKVFEPIKREDDKLGKADGKSAAVKVVGDHAFFTYDSFGIVSYSIADLIKPLAEGTDPTKIWGKGAPDQRPEYSRASSFRTLQSSTAGQSWQDGAAGWH